MAARLHISSAHTSNTILSKDSLLSPVPVPRHLACSQGSQANLAIPDTQDQPATRPKPHTFTYLVPARQQLGVRVSKEPAHIST